MIPARPSRRRPACGRGQRGALLAPQAGDRVPVRLHCRVPGDGRRSARLRSTPSPCRPPIRQKRSARCFPWTQGALLPGAAPQDRARRDVGAHPPREAGAHAIRPESAIDGDQPVDRRPNAATPAAFERDRLSFVDHHQCHALGAAYGSGLSSVRRAHDRRSWRRLVGDDLACFAMAGSRRCRQSPAAHSLGVFFEHVTMLLNMRELEDEGKVMALAEYASPVADADNPLLPLVTVEDGRIRCAVTGARARTAPCDGSTGAFRTNSSPTWRRRRSNASASIWRATP